MQAVVYKSHSNDANPNPTPLEKLPFQLQNGEKIIREIKPQFFGFMVTRAFGSYFAILVIAILAISGITAFKVAVEGFLIGIILIPLMLLLVSVVPFISYGKSWYWVTNNRVIGKRGLIGYSIDSIPLDNVSDIVLDRTALDRLLGISSLVVVPMGSSNSRVGTDAPEEKFQNSNFFPALPQLVARELQRVLFNLRDELRISQMMVNPTLGVVAPISSEIAQPKSSFPRGTT